MSIREGRLVFFPIDDSENCKKAFDWFISKEYVPGDRIEFFNVVTVGQPGVLYIDSTNADMKKCIASARQIATYFRDICRGLKIPYVTRMTVNPKIGNAILEEVVKSRANVVVISHGHRGKKAEAILGVSTKHVITHSPVPVIVVPSMH